MTSRLINTPQEPQPNATREDVLDNLDTVTTGVIVSVHSAFPLPENTAQVLAEHIKGQIGQKDNTFLELNLTLTPTPSQDFTSPERLKRDGEPWVVDLSMSQEDFEGQDLYGFATFIAETLRRSPQPPSARADEPTPGAPFVATSEGRDDSEGLTCAHAGDSH